MPTRRRRNEPLQAVGGRGVGSEMTVPGSGALLLCMARFQRAYLDRTGNAGGNSTRRMGSTDSPAGDAAGPIWRLASLVYRYYPVELLQVRLKRFVSEPRWSVEPQASVRHE